MKKKRGGQPGNKNSLKHGMYSTACQINAGCVQDKWPTRDLSPEINYARVLNARYLDSLNADSQSLDRETQLSALRVFTQTMHAIARLQRLNAIASIMNKDSDELRDQILHPTILRKNLPHPQR